MKTSIDIKARIKKNKPELIVVLIFMFCSLGFNIYRVQSDGLFYYKFLEKMLYVQHPENSLSELDPVFFYQSGCAFFNAPFYLIGYAIESLFHLKINFNGITLRQIAINLSSNFYMLCSLILTVKILRRLNFRNIILPIISILFATSAFTVSVIQSSFSHTTDIFIITFFVLLFIVSEEKHDIYAAWLGIVCIIAILIRYLNFILIVPLACYYFCSKKFKRLFFLLLGFFAISWLIPLIFYTFNGTIYPYYKTGFDINSKVMGISLGFSNNCLKLLIHPLHGLFIWSPVVILSILGLLFFPYKKQQFFGYIFLGIFFLLDVLLGFLNEWHGGWSFSNRYLVGLFPIYVIGLSGFLEKYGRRMIWLVVFLMLYSIILFLNWHLCIMNAEYGTPTDMVLAWIKGESTTSVDKTVNLKVVLNRLREMCRYKYIFRFFR